MIKAHFTTILKGLNQGNWTSFSLFLKTFHLPSRWVSQFKLTGRKFWAYKLWSHMQIYAVLFSEERMDVYIGETKQQLFKRMAQQKGANSSCQVSDAVHLHLKDLTDTRQSFVDNNGHILDRWYERGKRSKRRNLYQMWKTSIKLRKRTQISPIKHLQRSLESHTQTVSQTFAPSFTWPRPGTQLIVNDSEV